MKRKNLDNLSLVKGHKTDKSSSKDTFQTAEKIDLA